MKKKFKANPEIRYFNFPIQLLQGFMTEKNKVLNNIRDYAVCAEYIKRENEGRGQDIEEIEKYFGISTNNFRNGLDLFNEFSETNPPLSGISVFVWNDYYQHDKSHFEIACLLCFSAIKSIIGPDQCWKVTDLNCLSRMDGKPHIVSYPDELSPEIIKYNTRYRMIKIRESLKKSWGLEYYSHHTRGVYVSFKLSLDDLAEKAEKDRESYKKKERINASREARRKVLDKINGSGTASKKKKL